MLEVVDAFSASFKIPYSHSKSTVIEMIQDCRFNLKCRDILEEADIGEINMRRTSKIRLHEGQKGRGFRHRKGIPQKHMPLSDDFFSRSDNWVIDPLRIDWRNGLIVATAPTRFEPGWERADSSALTRRAASRVMIFNDESLIPANPLLEKTYMADAPDEKEISPDMTKKEKLKSGRKRANSWNDWVAELVIVAQSEGVHLFESGEALHGEIEDRLIARKVESPEWGTVEKAISAIRNRWKEARVNEELWECPCGKAANHD